MNRLLSLSVALIFMVLMFAARNGVISDLTVAALGMIGGCAYLLTRLGEVE